MSSTIFVPTSVISHRLLKFKVIYCVGGVISPLLANLFLHYAFDKWMQRKFPQIPFERYADDGICHCRSQAQAEGLRAAIEQRFAECGLELHRQKTRIIYCRDDRRRKDYPEQNFDFLGYTFRPRGAKDPEGKYFVGFNPAVSNEAAKSMREVIREWRLHRQTDKSLDELAQMINPVVRGWMNYYGNFYKSALYPTFQHLNHILCRWATRKYKRLRGHNRRALHWLQKVVHSQPELFAHWGLSQFKAGQ